MIIRALSNDYSENLRTMNISVTCLHMECKMLTLHSFYTGARISLQTVVIKHTAITPIR